MACIDHSEVQLVISPTPTVGGKWCTDIPECSGFKGTLCGVQGAFWKDPMAIREIHGRLVKFYWEQLGLEVQNYEPWNLK